MIVVLVYITEIMRKIWIIGSEYVLTFSSFYGIIKEKDFEEVIL